MKADYRVIDTDYENFAIVFSQNRVGLWDINFAWIFTRAAKVDNDVVDRLFDRLTELTGIQRHELHRTIQ